MQVSGLGQSEMFSQLQLLYWLDLTAVDGSYTPK